MADEQENNKTIVTETPGVANMKRTDTKGAVIAAHDQAEADIEADVELTDKAGPLEDLDEEETFRQSTDENALI